MSLLQRRKAVDCIHRMCSDCTVQKWRLIKPTLNNLSNHALMKMHNSKLCKARMLALTVDVYGRHHDLVNPYNVAVSRIISDVFQQASHRQPFKIPDIPLSRLFKFICSGLWAWGAKHVHHVMLTFSRRLVTLFPLGSMSVRPNEYSNLPIVYPFMSLLYGLGTLTTYYFLWRQENVFVMVSDL